MNVGKQETDIMTTDEQYMRKAIAEAEQAAAEGEIPIGAVVVCRGRILARTHNLTETLHDVTAHAEMQAITAAANALGGKYLHSVCDGGAVSHVRGSLGLVTDSACCLWRGRREARLPQDSPHGIAP